MVKPVDFAALAALLCRPAERERGRPLSNPMTLRHRRPFSAAAAYWSSTTSRNGPATMPSARLRMGAEVETRNDAVRRWTPCARYQPDIVLLPTVACLRSTATKPRGGCRANPAGRSATLVALTGWTRDDDVRRAWDAGFDHHLAKPVDPAALERLAGGARPARVRTAIAPRIDPRRRPPERRPARASWPRCSHAIRTPLNTVASAARLLCDSRLDEDSASSCTLLRRSSDALCAIVDDLIDLASIESGTFALDASSFSPCALVDECIALVGAEAAARHVELFRCAETSLPATVVGDAARIRRRSPCSNVRSGRAMRGRTGA